MNSTQLTTNDIIVILRSIINNQKPCKIELNYSGGGETFCCFKVREQVDKADIQEMKKET